MGQAGGSREGPNSKPGRDSNDIGQRISKGKEGVSGLGAYILVWMWKDCLLTFPVWSSHPPIPALSPSLPSELHCALPRALSH